MHFLFSFCYFNFWSLFIRIESDSSKKKSIIFSLAIKQSCIECLFRFHFRLAASLSMDDSICVSLFFPAVAHLQFRNSIDCDEDPKIIVEIKVHCYEFISIEFVFNCSPWIDGIMLCIVCRSVDTDKFRSSDVVSHWNIVYFSRRTAIILFFKTKHFKCKI